MLSQGEILAIARMYRKGKHEPFHPSYRAFILDTAVQFHRLRGDGWSFEHTAENPYANSADMFRDLATRKLKVFSGGSLHPTHPLAWRPYDSWSFNEMFRAVHDVLGHGSTLAPFETFDGEIEAYHNHARMYSPEAIPALYSETVGQLCHYYAGFGFVQEQKAVVLPLVLY